MNDGRVCIDCGGKILVKVEEGLQDAAYLCNPCYQERFAKSKFDEMPVSLNFGRSLKLTIQGRPVQTGVRVYEQAQDGLVSYGRRS